MTENVPIPYLPNELIVEKQENISFASQRGVEGSKVGGTDRFPRTKRSRHETDAAL
jgi:hypothetical protein